MDVVGCSRRPLESEAVEDLGGVVVGRFYPACLMTNIGEKSVTLTSVGVKMFVFATCFVEN